MKKRVLFLAHSSMRGGAEFCLDTTLRFLDRETIEPFVIFPTEGPMAESARAMGISVLILPFSWWMLYEPSAWEWKNRLRVPFRHRFLIRFIQENKIQAVYSNTACLFEGVLAARAAEIPHITHIHEVLEDRFMRPRWFTLPQIIRFYFENSKNVIFESESSRKIAEKHLLKSKPFSLLWPFGDWNPLWPLNILSASGITSLPVRERTLEKLLSKSIAISNSARLRLSDAEEFQSKNALDSWKQLANFGVQSYPSKWTLLWLGRFSERKNPLLLIQAAALLPENIRREIQIILAGTGPLEQRMRQEIQENALTETCRIVPFQDDIRPLLRLANALVLTSREESFGLVLVEAGMFARPLIAVRSQGPSEIILDTETGFLTEQNDARTLAERIITLFLNPELSQKMGENGRKRVLEYYDPVKNTAKITDLF